MKKALIVDDNKQNLYLMQTMLKGSGYDVLMAGNGVEALEQARRNPPDIIISDVLMPVMDGFALCREWQKDERLQQIPFVFYTATYTDPNDEELALILGASRFVVKPTDMAAFVALIRQVVEGHETGLPVAPSPSTPAKTDYYKLYSEALVRKLEDKMLALEEINRALESEITERKKAQEALWTVNAYNRGLIEVSIDPLITIGPDGIITDVNAASERVTGCTRDVLIGTDFSNYLSDPEMARVGYRRVFTEGHVRDYPLEIRHSDGHVTPALFNATLYHNEKGEMIGVFAAARDITERKRAEEKIKASLREKDILISEIHHRVKNNLQVISGLLNLQAKASKNPEVIEGFRESQDRIRAMALVHEKLYNVGDFSRIDLAGYVRSLSQELFQAHNIHSGKIDLTIQTDGEVHVDISKAIPCGLIMNELISNALKHAFPGDGPGKLQIIIRETKDSEIEIVVRDNGLGLPDHVDIHQVRSVGLHLVNGLTKNQLDGQMKVKRDNGTEFRITFPL